MDWKRVLTWRKSNVVGRKTSCIPWILFIATERQGEEYRAGYQEAVTEAVRYLAEVQGYEPGDGLSAQLAAHLHRHREHITKGKIE